MSIGADHTTPIHSDLIFIVVYKHEFILMWRLGVYRKEIISCSLT